MKTTIDIADPLFAQARALAHRERTTLRALIEDGLRKVLAERNAKPFKLRDASFKGDKGMNPEFAAGGWERIARAIYEDDE
jgi:hypothetical protein